MEIDSVIDEIDSEVPVPCKWCGQPTTATALKECPGHWELRHRIEMEPEMAEKMLKEFKNFDG